MNPTDLSWIYHPLMYAIGHALVHFLWQGLLVAGGMALALRMNRQASPHDRYRICLAALLLIVVLPVRTVNPLILLIIYHSYHIILSASEG